MIKMVVRRNSLKMSFQRCELTGLTAPVPDSMAATLPLTLVKASRTRKGFQLSATISTLLLNRHDKMVPDQGGRRPLYLIAADYGDANGIDAAIRYRPGYSKVSILWFVTIRL